MATLLYNPARPSLRPSRALSVLLADMLRDPQANAAPTKPAFVPAADILETPTGFEVQLALPGVKREDLNIEFLDGQLVVSGARPGPAAAEQNDAAENQPTAPKFRRLETNYGAFARRFRLPETVNVKAISAELTDGILRIALPFDTEKVTKHHIEIR